MMDDDGPSRSFKPRERWVVGVGARSEGGGARGRRRSQTLVLLVPALVVLADLFARLSDAAVVADEELIDENLACGM